MEPLSFTVYSREVHHISLLWFASLITVGRLDFLLLSHLVWLKLCCLEVLLCPYGILWNYELVLEENQWPVDQCQFISHLIFFSEFFVHVFVIQVEQRFLGTAASIVSGIALALEWMWFCIEINMAQSWYRLRSRIPKQWNSIQSVPGTNLYNERPIKLLAFTIYPSISSFMSRCLNVPGCVLHEVLSQNMFSSSSSEIGIVKSLRPMVLSWKLQQLISLGAPSNLW